MAITSKTAALKVFFSTEAKPVTNSELIDFRKADTAGYDKLGEEVLAYFAAHPEEESAATEGAR